MRVIVPVDVTGSSQPAIDTLIGMKWLPGTEIKLLAIISTDEQSRYANASKVCSAAEVEEALDELTRELQQVLPDCEVSRDVKHGDPANLIVGLATEWHATLILMGSRGNKGINLLLLGSVSQAVLNQAPCPVVIVKSEGAAELQDLQQGFRSVVVTVDSSPYARAALQWVKSINWAPETRFKLITVVESVPDSFSFESNTLRASRLLQEREAITRAATAEVNSMAKDLISLFGPNRVSVQIGEGEPQKTILSIASAARADLIVMGSHGRGGLTKLILGSVSQAVAIQAPCAVAVVRGMTRSSGMDLHRTGMFKKPVAAKSHHTPMSPGPAPRNSNSDRGQEVHIVPFGMG